MLHSSNTKDHWFQVWHNLLGETRKQHMLTWMIFRFYKRETLRSSSWVAVLIQKLLMWNGRSAKNTGVNKWQKWQESNVWREQKKIYVTLRAQHPLMLEKSFHKLSCWCPNCPLSRQRWPVFFFEGDYWGGQAHEVVCPWSQGARGTPGQDARLGDSSLCTLVCRWCQRAPICGQCGALFPIFFSQWIQWVCP